MPPALPDHYWASGGTLAPHHRPSARHAGQLRDMTVVMTAIHQALAKGYPISYLDEEGRTALAMPRQAA